MTMTTMQAKWPELLSELEIHITQLAKDFNLDDETCEQLGVSTADFIATHFSGQVVCFPKDYRYKLANRDLEIYRKFRGNNWRELVKEFNMTESGIRKVMARVRRAISKRTQPDLFDE